MDDLKLRFGTLDRIPMPELWQDVEARAASASRPVAGRVAWRGGRGLAPSTLWLLLVLLLMALVGVALIVGAARLDSRLIGVPQPSNGPSSVAITSPRPSIVPTTGSEACPSIDPPTELRVVPLSLPQLPTDIVERGCRVWVQLATNGAGIVRLNPDRDAPDATIAPDEITVFVDTSDPTLWVEAGPATRDGLPILGRIDPDTAAWQPVQVAGASAIVGDVIWRSDYRAVHTWTMRIGDETNVTPVEISRPRGPLTAAFGSMWVFVPGAAGGASTLLRYDPADARLVATIDVGTSGECIKTVRGFACQSTDGRRTGVSASTNTVEWSLPFPDAPSGNFAAVGGSLWLQPTASRPGRNEAVELIEVDLATGEVRRRLPLAVRDPLGLWGAAGSLWVSSSDPGVVRVDLPAGG